MAYATQPVSALLFRMQRKLLHAPVQQFGYVNFIFRRAGDFVNPAKLFQFFAGLAEPAQNFSVQAEFVDAARKGIRGVEDLIGSGRDANRPWRTGTQLPRVHICSAHHRFWADGWDSGCIIKGHIDFYLAKVLAFAIEDLDAGIAAVRDVNISLGIGSDAVRSVELSGAVARFSE